MARVCLVDISAGKFDFTYIPNGLLIIAAVLKEYGHNVTVYCGDGAVPQCDVLGISATMSTYPAAVNLARRSDADVCVLGGSLVTAWPIVANTPSFDYGVIGDGESAMTNIVADRDPRLIDGLAYKGQDCFTVNRAMYLNSPEIHAPDYSCLAYSPGEYVNVTKAKNWRFDGILWRRSDSLIGAKKFAASMVALKNLGVKRVHVTDEFFCGGRSRIGMALDVLDQFQSWSCRSDVSGVIDSRLDQKLAGSKCNLIELYVGTANKGLAAEHNLPDVEKCNLAIELLSNIGLRIVVMLGLPGETIQSIIETREWLRSIGLPVRIETFVPYPGSEAWECKFDRFGFRVSDFDYGCYGADHKSPIRTVPWRSNTIAADDFVTLRNELVAEFN